MKNQSGYARLIVPLPNFEEYSLVWDSEEISNSKIEIMFLEEKLNKLRNLNFELPIWLGWDWFLAEDLSMIEKGNIITFEEIQCDFDSSNLSGKGLLIFDTPDKGGFRININTEDSVIKCEIIDNFKKGEVRMEGKEKIPEPIVGEEALKLDETAKFIIKHANIPIAIELGKVKMSLAHLCKLRKGEIIELNKTPNDPVDLVLVDNRVVVARGKLVNIEGTFGVQIIEIFDKEIPSTK